MFIFELGTRLINLVYLIEAERIGAGKVRVTLASGNTFDHEGPDAERLVDQLRTLAADPSMRSSTSVVRYDTASGASGSAAG